LTLLEKHLPLPPECKEEKEYNLKRQYRWIKNKKVSPPIQYSKHFKTYLELAPPPYKLHNLKTDKTTLAQPRLEKHYINKSTAEA
jgi:hypothetical protein